MLRIDGAQPPSTALIQTVDQACDQAERDGGGSVLTWHVSGCPERGWTADLNVALVSKWERAVRRLERSGAPVAVVASGDCGGVALDVLLAADVRVVTPDTRLVVTVGDGAIWPGMAMFRIVQQAGLGAGRRALLFGAPIDARQALAACLVDEVADDGAGALGAIARLISEVNGTELVIRRQLMFDAAWRSFEDALGPHLAACDRSLRRVCGRAE